MSSTDPNRVWARRTFAAASTVILLAIIGMVVDTFPLRLHAKPIRVGFNDFSPYISVTGQGQPAGLAVDVIREAARRSGQKLLWVRVNTGETALRDGTIDVYPLLTVSPERIRQFYFSDYWWQNTLELVSLQQHSGNRTVDVDGRRIGVRIGGFVAHLAHSLFPTAKLVVKPDASTLVDSLCSGEIDALFADTRAIERQLINRSIPCRAVVLKIAQVSGATLSLGTASTRIARNQASILYTHINEVVADGTLAILASTHQLATPESNLQLAQLVQERERRFLLEATCVGLGCLLVCLGFISVRMQAAQFAAADARLRLEESEQRFHAYMDHLTANAFMKDSSGRMVYVNEADAKMFGLRPEECLGKTNYELMPHDVAERVCVNDRLVLESNDERQFDELVPDHEGNVRHWLTLKFPFRSRSGEVFLGGISVEITEMARVQIALRESESRYRQIVEFAGDIIVRCDALGRVTYVNEMGARVLKIPARELRGRRALQLIRREDRKRVLDTLREEFAQGVTDLYIEVPVTTGDGAELWLGQTIRVLRNSGVVTGVQAISRDITERRRMEAELRSSEERFRLLYENGPVAYHEIDRQGVIRRVNRAECEMLGISAEELVGRPVVELMAAEDREIARAAIAAKVDEKLPLNSFQRTYVRPDGRRVRVEIHENLLRDADGKVIGIHSVLLDITVRQLAEVLDQDRREISEMIAQRQPLDAILRRISLMISHYDDSLCCVPLRLIGEDEDRKLEPVNVAENKDLLCAAIRELGPAAFCLCNSEEFQVCHLNISDLALKPATATLAIAASQLGMESCWSIPVLSSSQHSLGMLLVFSPRAGEATSLERQLLETTSRIAAVGIENRYLSDLLAFQAGHDNLTRLPNRGTFNTRLEDEISQARTLGERLAVFYVDLDRFKEVNDTFGHSGGDELLQQVGVRLRRCIRQSDMLARIGGDEFSLLLPRLHGPAEASRVAEAILRAFHAPFLISGTEVFVTSSIGISFYPDDGQDAATLQRNSDTAMYRVKNSGRNSFRLFAGVPRDRAKRVASPARSA